MQNVPQTQIKVKLKGTYFCLSHLYVDISNHTLIV